MKFNNKHCFWALLGLGMALVGCKSDNMDEPNCNIQGRVVYQGVPLGVRASGTSHLSGSQVKLELWQSGFGRELAQSVNVQMNGEFNAIVYPGLCRLVTVKGVGPWEMADTMRVNVRGNVRVDYEVTPYFTISDVSYEFNADTRVLTARFNVEQVVEDSKIKTVGLLVNNTRFVDLSYNKKMMTTTTTSGAKEVSVDLSSLGKECRLLYARVFVLSSSASEALYSLDPWQVW